MTQFVFSSRPSAVPSQRATIQQLWRFGAVGLCNTALTYALILLLKPALGILLANLLGYAAGLALSFALNRRFTFGRKAGEETGAEMERPRADFSRFLLICALAFVANYLVIRFGLLLSASYPVAQLTGSVVYACVSFHGMKHHVFRA